MATTQRFRRLLGLILAAAATWAVVVPSHAGQNWMPLLPSTDFHDFQLFAPPDLQDYAVRPDPREGIFFSYDRTYWGLTPAQSRPILNDFFIPVQPLSPFAVAQQNNNLIQAGYPSSGLFIFGSDPLRLDLNTNWMRTGMSWGNRFEGGWLYDDFGMMFNYYNSGLQGQDFQTTNSFAVNSPFTTFTQQVAQGGGFIGGNPLVVTTITSTSPPPDHIIHQNLTQRNLTELQSGGFSWIVRRNLSSAGSGQLNLLRFSLGPKWMSVADRYSITYTSQQESFVNGCPQGDFCPLQNGGWDTSAYNNIVGPEFGLNYQVERGRWTIETDLRFVAGMNWQNTLYRGSNFPAALGADYFRTTYTFANSSTTGGNTNTTQNVGVGAPPLFVQIYGVGQTNATNTAEHNFVFSPLGEWRLRGRYRVSQAISMNVGYTGMWLAGITRASTNTEFRADRKQVLTATQNGPPTTITIPNPQYNPNQPADPTTNPQFIDQTLNTWTPPPIDPAGTGNNQVRVYNSVGPRAGNDLGYMFVNGVDFGIEVNY